MEQIIFVPDMRCNHCVARITAALNEISADFTVDLSTKTVTVRGEEGTITAAFNEIYDLGFTPERKWG